MLTATTKNKKRLNKSQNIKDHYKKGETKTAVNEEEFQRRRQHRISICRALRCHARVDRVRPSPSHDTELHCCIVAYLAAWPACFLHELARPVWPVVRGDFYRCKAWLLNVFPFHLFLTFRWLRYSVIHICLFVFLLSFSFLWGGLGIVLFLIFDKRY